ncbi:MAG: hypothetical protein MUP53_05565 [Bacteroidales bacterium]|nr:hypothetical protein [Bacteroidales bacterium]
MCAIASASLLLLSATAFNAVAAAPPVVEEEASNNLSVPAIFAEGYGLTGFPAYEKSGLPGGLTPTWGTPYCYQNTEYFLQATDSLWQGQWSADALTNPVLVSVTVDWSDEVVKKVWNEKSVIPVGVTLYKDLADKSMIGYEMTSLPAGILPCDPPVLPEEADTSVVITSEEEVDEIWGTTGSPYESDRATVYSICPRLTIQKISESGDLQEPIFDSAVYEGFGVTGKPDWYSATIDGAGKIVYLYNWNLALMQEGPDVNRSGWYRLSFSLDEKATYTISQGKNIVKETFEVTRNTSLDALDASDETGVTYAPVLVSPDQKTYVDIYISQETIGE